MEYYFYLYCRRMQLSAYTALFGKNLLKAYEVWLSLPGDARGDTRVCKEVDLSCTDKELFDAMPLGDLWLDARIHEVFLYLYNCKYVEPLGLTVLTVWKPQAASVTCT